MLEVGIIDLLLEIIIIFLTMISMEIMKMVFILKLVLAHPRPIIIAYIVTRFT